jgi:hypothetical protein
MREAFEAGAAVAVNGGVISKPASVCETDARRFKRLIERESSNRTKVDFVQSPPVKLPLTISKLVQCPVDGRASFEMTAISGQTTHTLRRLDGATLGSYQRMRDLFLEACIVLPAANRRTKDAWDALLAEAFSRVQVRHVEAEGSALLAIRQEIAELLLSSDLCDSESDLRRGLVFQDEKTRGVSMIPRALVSRVRARMAEDRPTREQIVDAAKLLGMDESRPLLGDGKRPRVWSFPYNKLMETQS